MNFSSNPKASKVFLTIDNDENKEEIIKVELGKINNFKHLQSVSILIQEQYFEDNKNLSAILTIIESTVFPNNPLQVPIQITVIYPIHLKQKAEQKFRDLIFIISTASVVLVLLIAFVLIWKLKHPKKEKRVLENTNEIYQSYDTEMHVKETVENPVYHTKIQTKETVDNPLYQKTYQINTVLNPLYQTTECGSSVNNKSRNERVQQNKFKTNIENADTIYAEVEDKNKTNHTEDVYTPVKKKF